MAAGLPLNLSLGSGMEFVGGKKIELHDAVLERIELSWGERICKVFVRPVGSANIKPRNACVVFLDVKEVRVPREDSWGPSSNILEVKEGELNYVIAMQSGDEIIISARRYMVEEL